MNSTWYEVQESLHVWEEQAFRARATLTQEVWDWVAMINDGQDQVELKLGIWNYWLIRFITEHAQAQYVLRFGMPT